MPSGSGLCVTLLAGLGYLSSNRAAVLIGDVRNAEQWPSGTVLPAGAGLGVF